MYHGWMKNILLVASISLFLLACNTETVTLSEGVSPIATSVSRSPLLTPTISSSLTATTTPTLTPGAKLRSTVLPSPTNTPTSENTPIKTPTPIFNPIVLLQASRFERSSDVKILDYLYQYPESPYRQALLYKVISLHSYKPSQWVLEDWLEEFVVRPFNDAGGLPTGFEQEWKKWGEIFTGDFDGNGEPDYVITFGEKCLDCFGEGHIYWIHQNKDQYKATSLFIKNYLTQENDFIEVYAFDDLTGDNQSELVYSAVGHGPSDRFDTLQILSWQNGQLANLLPAGYLYLINGDVAIQDKDGDRIAEIIVTEGSTGYPGVGPSLPYKIHLNLHNNEYIPVQQSMFDESGSRWSDPLTYGKPGNDAYLIVWQQAKQLLHTKHFTEALEKFKLLAQEPSSSFDWVDYRPYSLFNIGVIHTILGNQDAAQDVWEQLAIQFSNHPVGVDVVALKEILKDKEDLPRTCTWLQENAARWKETRWIASEKAIYDSKWVTLVEGQGIDPNEARTILKADEIDYAKERETLEYIAIRPDYYRHHIDWWGFCHPMFLLPLYTWQQQETIDNQMNRYGLNWQTVSTDYDLNNDAVSDVIGFLEMDKKRFPWAFISHNDDNYQPLFIMQPYPVEAINVWNVTQYNYDQHFLPEMNMEVIASDENNSPKVVIGNAQVYQWLGHHFQPVSAVSAEVELPSPLDQAIEYLFRYKQPQEAFNILEEYDPGDDRFKTAQLYLQALALEYDKQYKQAQLIFNELIKSYPDTDWAVLAKEKLKVDLYN